MFLVNSTLQSCVLALVSILVDVWSQIVEFKTPAKDHMGPSHAICLGSDTKTQRMEPWSHSMEPWSHGEKQ